MESRRVIGASAILNTPATLLTAFAYGGSNRFCQTLCGFVTIVGHRAARDAAPPQRRMLNGAGTSMGASARCAGPVRNAAANGNAAPFSAAG
jgi:hypothetical protein